MPDALDVPDDLVQLQRSADEAQAALREPNAGPPSGWTPEQRQAHDERWEAWRRAIGDVMDHPVMRRATAEHCFHQTQVALRAQARHTASG
ncbi:hypothetical protein ABZ746_36620 [Streptomyces sp. NPDC020096]